MAEGQSLDKTVVNSDNTEIQSASPDLHLSSRNPILTEKGLQYQRDIYNKIFRSCVSKWRRQSVQVSIIMSDSSEVKALRDERTNLENSFAELCTAYDQLNNLSADDNIEVRSSETFDKIEIEHQLIMCRISEKISELQVTDFDLQSIRSQQSNRSNRSRRSYNSVNIKTSNPATEAAVLSARLKYIEAEAHSRAQFEKITTIKKLEMAKARLMALDQELVGDNQSDTVTKQLQLLVDIEDKSDFVQKYVDTQSHSIQNDYKTIKPSHLQYTQGQSNTHMPQFTTSSLPFDSTPVVALNPAVDPFMPKSSLSKASVPHDSQSAINTQAGQDVLNNQVTEGYFDKGVEQLTKSLVEQICLNRLPPPEPGIFFGDPLKYPAWKTAFNTLIENSHISPSEKIHYLKRYIGGPVREVVESYFLLSSDDSYDEARSLLDERYGDPYILANAFRERLEKWPKIAARDGHGLRRFSDFLRQCDTAMRSIGSLGCLNDDRENRKLLLKLPEWIVTRWNRSVVKWKDQKGSFPPFSEFVNFIVCEAKIACDPITSLQSLKSDQTSSESDKSDRRPRYENSRRPPVRGYSNFTDTKHKTPYVPPNSGISSNCCQICKGKHDLDQCSQFVSRSLNDRKAYIKDNKLCFACLKPNHVSKFCRQRKQCKTCSKFHPTSLHGDVTKSENPTDISKNGSKDQPPSDVKILSNTSFSTSTSSCLKCSMIVPVYVSQKDNPTEERLVYALLDTQSDTTFILSHTCQNLGISGTKVKLLLSTLHSENHIVSSERIKNLVVRPFDSDLRMDIPNAYTRSIMPANRSHIPSPQIAEKWPHLAPIVDKLMPVSNCEVGLLIGYDCSRALLPREIIAPDGDGPYAQRTDLGWGIVGIVGSDNVHSCNDEIGVSHRVVSCEVPHNLVSGPTHMLVSLRNSVKELVNPHEVAKMMELDFSECSSSCDISMSREDQKFISLLQEGIHMTDGHYEMPLPFKDFVPVLPDNRSLALHRLGQLGKRLAKDDLYQTQYTAFIEDMIKKGYAERVPMEDIDRKDGHVWYIPHHGVFHPQKPDKIRVVFDCSAQFKDKSLNGLLLQGPDLISNLIGVLCRFRKEVVAFTCDIQQMFHQFRVNPEHRDFLRFLWWKDGDLNADVETYHMNVHLFGAVSSPGCSNFALKQVASDYEAEFGSDCASFIRRDFYVDDGLKSVPSVNDAISLINRSKEMCSKAGLHLHKFQSSSKDVLNHIPVDDRSSCLRDIDLLRDDLPVERTLGIQWCVESDTFQFRITLKDNPFSRRGVLSTLSSVYDPLGFLAPVILIGKQLLQQMCRNNTDWDSPLSDDFKPLWERWRHDILQLHSLQVPRCIKPADFGSIVRSELHNFSDASFKGYGQCSYLRLIDSRNHVHCSLLLGKSRVHPLKQTTIPRLELTAAVVSVKVGNLLQLELDLDHIEQWYWTDSNVVLGYISNDSRRFHIFVANRVQEIRNHTEPNQWKFVKSADNPADIASRGAYAQELLESSWFTGPKFLWEPSIPSVNDDTEIRNLSPDDPEVKKSIVHTSSAICAHSSILERIGYFSDWTRAKKAIAVCLRFKEMLVKRSIKRCSNVSCKFDVELRLKNYHPVQVNEVQSAEREIIKLVQKDAFSDEHELLSAVVKSQNKNSNLKHFNVLQKGSPIFKLDPYMDGECIIRVGGRLANSQFSLSEKHPIILPRKGHVSDLILRHFHERVKHQGRGMTINEIRANGFWLLGCSSAVSYLISRCLICRKLRGSLQVQKMANLPSDRLEPTTPFTYSGVDYFGPFYIKEGRKELKRWGVLFTCLCCRAVHVEVACSLDTSSFINALRRFLSIRGSVRVLRSDRGTNFVGAQHELKDAFGEMNFDQIRHFLLNEGCDFQFNMNVPSASHMGGIWERQIRSVRNILSALMLQNGSQLDDEALRTFMCEAAAIVNSRPITVMNVNDPLSAEPLTPNHLLTCKSKIILPPPGNFKRCDLFSRKRWRRIQYLANEFWVRWKREYLHNLQERAKWIPARRNLCVGDVVMIMDENLPRGLWRLGMVSEVFPSSDDLVRKVKVQVGEPGLDNKGKRIRDMSFLERPVHKLILLRETE